MQNNQPHLTQPQTILITGASDGIGRCLALELASQGHTIIALARRKELLDSLNHPNIKTLCFDLQNIDLIDEIAKKICIEYPTLSIVIHNAAIQHENEMLSIGYTQGDIAQEIAINLTAPIALTHALLPHLTVQPKACLCYITSVLALAAKRKSAVYCATKAGLHLFSQSLGAQLRDSTVQITEVLPPTVNTRMTAHRNVPKMTAQQVALDTIQGIKQGKRMVYPGKAKLFVLLLGLFPKLAKNLMLKF